MISFDEIQQAFFFVSSAGYGMNSAVICKDTGQVFYRSEMGDVDEIDEDALDWNVCVAVPHKNDLHLGRDLVFEFVEAYMSNSYDHVRQIFRRRGAYGRFKDLVDRKGLLEIWYDFENQREEEALRRWCKDNEIELSD